MMYTFHGQEIVVPTVLRISTALSEIKQVHVGQLCDILLTVAYYNRGKIDMTSEVSVSSEQAINIQFFIVFRH